MPIGLLATTFGATHLAAHAVTGRSAIGPLPIATGTWQGPLPEAVEWQPRYPGASEERRAAYRSGPGVVELYVNVFSEQRQGAELVGYGNTFLGPGAWRRAWPVVAGSLGKDLVAFEAWAPDGTLWLISSAYEVGGLVTRSDPTAQLAYGIMSVLHPVPAGVLALATRCDENCDAARALVASFWDDMSGLILATVPDSATAAADR